MMEIRLPRREHADWHLCPITMLTKRGKAFYGEVDGQERFRTDGARPKVEFHNSMIPCMQIGNINTTRFPIRGDDPFERHCGMDLYYVARSAECLGCQAA